MTSVLRGENDVSEYVARLVFVFAEAYPRQTVLLPTGPTSTDLFRAILGTARDYGARRFSESKIDNDTETFGVWLDTAHRALGMCSRPYWS